MWPDLPNAPRHDDRPTVPAPGLLNRVLASTITNPAAALDRLDAIEGLRRLLSEAEAETVIGARLAGCSRDQTGAAIGAARTEAAARWSDQVRRCEAAGLHTPDPAPVAPDEPDAAAHRIDRAVAEHRAEIARKVAALRRSEAEPGIEL